MSQDRTLPNAVSIEVINDKPEFQVGAETFSLNLKQNETLQVIATYNYF